MNKMDKICFVSLNSYPLLTNKNLGYAGGAEFQQAMIGKELSNRGYDITFLTYKEFETEDEWVDKIKIIPVYRRKEVKFLTYFEKFLILWKKMKKIDADFYIYQAGSLGIVSVFSFFHKKIMIKMIASNGELNHYEKIKIISIDSIFSKISTLLNIRLADIVISQNNFQKEALTDKFNIESKLIKNPIQIIKCTKNNGDFILWVGTIREVKQPQLFLELAKKLPNYRFIMIGGMSKNKELYRNIKHNAKLIPNLEFKGFIPHHEIYTYYKNALFLVNTSKYEGFPNIFLEAWMHYKPVVSLNVNPDGIINEYTIGLHSKNFSELIKNVNELYQNNELRKKMGENGRKYVEKEHDIKKIVDKFEHILKNI